MAQLPDGRALPGKLFIVEGIDGSGKSTQLDLLRKWLIGLGYCVAFSEWNSSPVVKATTKRGKKKQILTPTSFSLIHAADLADRLERQVLPALKAGAIVLADRYIYTAFARDVARGVSPTWVRKLYAFAVRGNHKKVLEQLVKIEKLGEQFKPLVTELRAFARNFDTDAVVDILEEMGVKP